MRSIRFRLSFSPRPRRGGGAIVRVGAAIASGVVCAAVAAAPTDPPRDYGAEAIAMIAEAQGVAADERAPGWLFYQDAATSIGAAARLFVMPLDAPGGHVPVDDRRRIHEGFAAAVFGWLADPERKLDLTMLAYEGERLMQAMDQAGWWEALRPVRQARAFVPLRQRGPMRHWDPFLYYPPAVSCLCMGRMQRAMEAGDFATAAVAFEDTLALTRAMSWTPHLVGGYRTSALHTILHVAELWRGQPEFARSALVAIERQAVAPARVRIEYARLMGLEAIDARVAQHVRQEIERRRAEGANVDEETLWALVAPVVAPPHEQIELFNAVLDIMVELLEARGEAIAATTARLDEALEHLDRHLVAGFIIPAAGLYQEQQMRARDGAVRIALALEIHRAEAGEYPQSLAELEALDELPPDPWSDEPLRYRREADGSAIVYSVGQDGVDDRGRENSERPRAPEEQAPREMWEGFDLILYRAPGT